MIFAGTSKKEGVRLKPEWTNRYNWIEQNNEGLIWRNNHTYPHNASMHFAN